MRSPRISTADRRWAAAFGAAALASLIASCAASDPGDRHGSVARLTGDVCGTELSASGVVIEPGYVLTAAHNVAGSDGAVTVSFEGGDTFEGAVIAFDPLRDLALVSIPGDPPEPILRTIEVHSDGEIVRLRDGAEPETVPYRDGRALRITGSDIYDEPTSTTRDGVRVTADIGPGYSGGPLINDSGEMVGLVFAESRRSGFVYGVASTEIDTFLATAARSEDVDTGRCLP